jgi:hypothetical protein
MAKTHLKKFSPSLAIKEMQIKTTLRFHLSPVRIATIHNTNSRVLVLTPVILATQEAEIRRIEVQTNSSARPYLKKPFTKIGLVEWLKVKALSSNPSITKK